MKLVSITLSDIRRFTTPVTVAGLGPGVNVLTAPNESGKSTLFDAIQALFFLAHRGRNKEIRGLQPHAGGRPTVSVELDLPDGRYRVTKRWLSGAMAEVHAGDRLLAKGDAAEAWVSAQVAPDMAGGPTGLLWVRQGVTHLGAEGQSARRDLLSSVAGEIEAMTGGRRMDLALARCTEDLGKLVTATGRSYAKGPLKAAEDEVAALAEQEAELAVRAQELAQAIAERRGLRREAKALRDPEETARAEAALDAARTRRDAARHSAEAVDRAGEQAVAARQALAHATERRDGFAALIAACETARQQAAAALAEEAAAAAVAERRQAALAAAEAALSQARAGLTMAETGLLRATAAEAAGRDRQRRAELDAQLTTARAHAAALSEARAAAQSGPDAKAMAALDAAQQALRVQEALRAQAALSVTMHYATAEAAVLRVDTGLDGGTDLAEAVPVALPEGGRLRLDGIGTLTITPGARADEARVYETARASFARALAATGAERPEDARRQAQLRADAVAQMAEARAALKALAPDGLAALEADRAALGDAPAVPEDPVPDRAMAEQAVTKARGVLAQAQAEADRCASSAQSATLAQARAVALREAAETRQTEAEAAVGPDPTGEAAARAAAVARAAEAEAEAAAEVRRRAAEAPDLAAAEAGFARAQSALDTAATRLGQVTVRLAALDEKIALRAGEGVGETLAETRDRLDEARARLARYQTERDLLTLLHAELTAARISARELYFEPVLRELRPLLHVLWPGAELSFDTDTILPTTLTRAGQAEAIDALSGGTREQIALLTRLAFARLLARAGRPAPVIFDDALVFTDDDRIERMFDTLHRQVGVGAGVGAGAGPEAEMQLVVLSCRQRAFRALGGRAVSFEPGVLPPEAAI